MITCIRKDELSKYSGASIAIEDVQGTVTKMTPYDKSFVDPKRSAVLIEYASSDGTPENSVACYADSVSIVSGTLIFTPIQRGPMVVVTPKH